MGVFRLAMIAVVVLMVLGACGSGESTRESSQSTETADTPSDPPSEVPDVDTSRSSVPLDQILFDTFDGQTVPLSESTPELRSRLLDAIPPIDDPVYEGPEGGDWLAPDDLILGYIAGGDAYAYPFKILNFHEIVNDELGGIPVLISYCPLCRSGIVYDRRVDGRVFEFGNTSALYESDLVMVDRGTGSYWWQVAGEAIVGELTGTTLTPLSSFVAPWEEWKRLHPETRVLSRDTGFARPYERDPFLSYPERIDDGQFPFPVGDDARDDRLAASTLVVGVEIDDVHRVYPMPMAEEPINDEIAGTPVVVLSGGDGSTAAVFSPIVDGNTLHFERVEDGFVDDATGSLWTATGEAVEGPLSGQRLTAIPNRTTFWFAYVAAFPDVQLYRP